MTKDFFRLFWSFFKIGFFTFGGGLAMIPFIEEEFTKKLRWLTSDEMSELVLLSQSLPGVVAVNVSILIGQKRAGVLGSVAAALGTVLPALLSIVLILCLLRGFEDNRYVRMVFTGIKAASAALILHTVWRLGRRIVGTTFADIVALGSFIMVSCDISAGWAIVVGALCGLVFYNFYIVGKGGRV